MFPVQTLREFVSGRLAAAAAEIFTGIERILAEYEEDIWSRRRPDDVTWRTPAAVPQLRVLKEEELSPEQQLCHDERKSSHVQEGAEPLQLEDEQEELCSVHDVEQLDLNQEADASVLDLEQEDICPQLGLEDVNWNPEIRLHRIDGPQQLVCKQEETGCEQQDRNQAENLSLNQEDPELLKQNPDAFMFAPVYEGRDFSQAELNTPQLYCQNFPLLERPNEDQSKILDSGPTPNVEMDPTSGRPRDRPDSKNVDLSSVSLSVLKTKLGNKLVHCGICGKVFTGNYQLRRHHRIHTGEKPFGCNTCGKVFGRKYHLLRHMTTHTREEKPFICGTCGEAFKCKKILFGHLTTHTDNKPFCCVLCGKNFVTRRNLRRHIRTHTGEKPFSCGTCGKSYTRKYNLKWHMSFHSE